MRSTASLFFLNDMPPEFAAGNYGPFIILTILMILCGGLLYLILKKKSPWSCMAPYGRPDHAGRNTDRAQTPTEPAPEARTFEGIESALTEQLEISPYIYAITGRRPDAGADPETPSHGVAEYSRDLAALSRLATRVFSSDLSQDDIIDRFMTAVTRGLGYERSRLYLIDSKNMLLEMKRESGLGEILPVYSSRLTGGDPLSKLARTGKALVFEDVRKDPGARSLVKPGSVAEPLSLALLPVLSRTHAKKCWDAHGCTKSDCPAFNREDEACWQVPDTLCRNTLVEFYQDKLTYCTTCDIFPVLGVLIVAADPRVRRLRGRNMSVLRIVTAEMGAALESHRLHDDNQKLLEQVLELQKVTSDALANLSLDKALEEFKNTALRFSGLDACSFWIASPDEPGLIRTENGMITAAGEDHIPRRLPIDCGVVGAAYAQNRLLVQYAAPEKDLSPLGVALRLHGLNSLLAVPLSTAGRSFGVFTVYKKSTAPFLETEIASFMLLANEAAMTINACMLNEAVKKQNSELARNMRLLEEILSNMSGGVLLLDMERRVKLVNLKGAQILRGERDRMIGRLLSDILPDAGLFLQPDQGTYRESIIPAADGAAIPIGFSSTYCYGVNGEQDGIIIDFRDLTELKALQSELIDKERFAAMGRVVAGVAHEIRNPLFGISSIGQIFEREVERPEHRDLARALLSETWRLNRLVEELLIYGRPMKIALEPCDLRKLWTDVLEFHQNEIRKKDIQITGDCALRSPIAHLDAHQVRQVFLNLLRNSLEAVLRGGEINIKLLLEDCFIIFTISDNGAGIPAQYRDRVFDLFFTTKPRGTGLGLAICRKIVQDHGGEITIESEEGKGTTVTVKLPYRGSGTPVAGTP